MKYIVEIDGIEQKGLVHSRIDLYPNLLNNLRNKIKWVLNKEDFRVSLNNLTLFPFIYNEIKKY